MLFTPIILLWAASIIPGIFAVPLDLSFGNNAGDDENKKHFSDAMPEVNRQINAMQQNLADANGGRSKEFLAAFGDKADVDQVRKRVKAMKNGDFLVESAQTSNDVTLGGVPKGANGMGQAKFGLGFHKPPPSVKDLNGMRAGTIIHEASHQLVQTGDKVVDGTKQIIKPFDDDKIHKQASSAINGYAATSDVIKSEADLGDNYKKLRDSSPNMHDNADSYRVYANLCSKSLYRRALLEDDPIAFYLAKRQSCTLPPDYFAKKAAAKAKAAAPGAKTSSAAAKGTAKGTKTAAAAPKTPASKTKGLKASDGAGVKGPKAGDTLAKGAKGKLATGAGSKTVAAGTKKSARLASGKAGVSGKAVGAKAAVAKKIDSTSDGQAN
jgi:hypothetical protein